MTLLFVVDPVLMIYKTITMSIIPKSTFKMTAYLRKSLRSFAISKRQTTIGKAFYTVVYFKLLLI
jgi:hypothetical protein